MVPVARPKTNEKFASREKIRKWKTGITLFQVFRRGQEFRLTAG
jgi:hypothetical protein